MTCLPLTLENQGTLPALIHLQRADGPQTPTLAKHARFQCTGARAYDAAPCVAQRRAASQHEKQKKMQKKT